MRKCVAGIGLTLLLLAPAPGFCSMVSPLAPVGAAVSFDVTLADTRYEMSGDRFEISRTIEAATWSYESFYATLGYVSATNFESFETAEFEGDEDGYIIAFGARGPVWRAGDFSAVLHAQFHSLNETVLENRSSRDMQSLEILAGADAVWSSGGWSVYGGAEVAPYSDVDFDTFGSVERADFISLRAGGRVPLGPVSLDVEVPFLGTVGVRIGLSYAF